MTSVVLRRRLLNWCSANFTVVKTAAGNASLAINRVRLFELPAGLADLVCARNSQATVRAWLRRKDVQRFELRAGCFDVALVPSLLCAMGTEVDVQIWESIVDFVRIRLVPVVVDVVDLDDGNVAASSSSAVVLLDTVVAAPHRV